MPSFKELAKIALIVLAVNAVARRVPALNF
ncbi:MAG: hypothetical protein FMNOHCHN_03648 [Ignavibacteriaceae bacterium]|nr:hypothetical protein [Ignavibacteriaceae bacterium]